MTKNISLVSLWYNGTTQSATKLLLKAVDDDLDSKAVYYYELQNSSGSKLASGNLILTDTTYANRTGNAYVWSWAASQLNLTLTE